MFEALKKLIIFDMDFYLSFQGRVSREQFLLHWLLPMFIAWLVVIIVGSVVHFLPPLFGLLTIWPVLAVNAKRLHDRGKSGWTQLFLLIPVIGFIWWLWDIVISRGRSGPNEFGPPPPRIDLKSL